MAAAAEEAIVLAGAVAVVQVVVAVAGVPAAEVAQAAGANPAGRKLHGLKSSKGIDHTLSGSWEEWESVPVFIFGDNSHLQR